MNDELRGKRLLLLGSSVWKDELRRFADEHGITLAVVGSTTVSTVVELNDPIRSTL